MPSTEKTRQGFGFRASHEGIRDGRAQRGRRERHQVLARVRLFLVGRVAPSNNSGTKPTCRGCSGVGPYGREPVPVHHTQTLVGGGVFVSMTGLSPRSKGGEIRDGNRRERYRANRVIANEARWRLRAGRRRDRTSYGVCGVACGLLLGTDLAGRRLVLGPRQKVDSSSSATLGLTRDGQARLQYRRKGGMEGRWMGRPRDLHNPAGPGGVDSGPTRRSGLGRIDAGGPARVGGIMTLLDAS